MRVPQPPSEESSSKKVTGLEKLPLMSCEAIRKAACRVKELGSLEDRKAKVRQLHDEILRYAHYTEPELEPAILLNIWGTWVKDGVANPDADLFVSCLEALDYAECGAIIPGTDWNQWLQDLPNLAKVASRILQSEYEDDRCEMLQAVILVVNSFEGLATLIDVIDRFDDPQETEVLYKKVGVAFDILAKGKPDVANRSGVKQRLDDFHNSRDVHSQVQVVINEGLQLHSIRPKPAKNRQNGQIVVEEDSESPEAEWKRIRQEIAQIHYKSRYDNYKVALLRTLDVVLSAPVEQAAVAFARLHRTLCGKEPIHQDLWPSFLSNYVLKNLPSAGERYATLIRS